MNSFLKFFKKNKSSVSNKVETNYAVPVSAYVREWIEANPFSIEEIDRHAVADYGVSLTDLIMYADNDALDLDFAMKIEAITGLNYQSLMRLDAQYVKDCERLGISR